MRVKVYQIDHDRDVNRVKFMPLDFTSEHGGVDPGIYNEVLNADMDASDPEDVFTQLNTGRHPLLRGHSLSVSDVVVNEDGAFFCDSFGFKKIDFDESQTHKPDNLMRVLYVEPHRIPYETEIPHTLAGMQQEARAALENAWRTDPARVAPLIKQEPWKSLLQQPRP